MAAEVEGKTLGDGPLVASRPDGPESQGLVKDLTNKPDAASTSSSSDGDAGTINEKALVRKIDWRLLPAVGILYLLSCLDRSNVGNARIEGLADDLHMTGNQYLTGLTLYFIGYVLFEVRPCPSAVIH
jgi:hypothetical protein